VTEVGGCAAAVVVCGRSRGRLVYGCGCMHCVGQAASGGACGRGCSACARLRCVGESAVSGRNGTGGAWPRLRAVRSCLRVESASVWRAWPRLRAVRSCLRVESASVWRAWSRLRAVRSCLRVESASVWREGHARRHADRCRSSAIRRDRGAVKRHNYAIDPACRSTAWVIGCRSCQDGPPFWCLRGRLHIERVGYNVCTPATEPSNDCSGRCGGDGPLTFGEGGTQAPPPPPPPPTSPTLPTSPTPPRHRCWSTQHCWLCRRPLHSSTRSQLEVWLHRRLRQKTAPRCIVQRWGGPHFLLSCRCTLGTPPRDVAAVAADVAGVRGDFSIRGGRAREGWDRLMGAAHLVVKPLIGRGKRMTSPPAPRSRVKLVKGDGSLASLTLPLRHPGSPRAAMYTDSWPLPAHTRAPLTRTHRTHCVPQGASSGPRLVLHRSLQPWRGSLRPTPQVAAPVRLHSSAAVSRSRGAYPPAKRRRHLPGAARPGIAARRRSPLRPLGGYRSPGLPHRGGPCVNATVLPDRCARPTDPHRPVLLPGLLRACPVRHISGGGGWHRQCAWDGDGRRVGAQFSIAGRYHCRFSRAI